VTRYVADYLITMEGEPTVITGGVVDVREGEVTWSGPADAAPSHDGDEVRLEGMVTPGFVNTHAHTPMVLLRGAGEGLPVDRWLAEVMWPRESRLTAEDVWWGMTLGASQLLGGGVTTTHEMYFFSGAVAEASVSAGIRTVATSPILTGELFAHFGTWESQLDGIVDLADQHRSHPSITVGLAPHSAYALSEECLKGVAAVAAVNGLHIHIHVAEGEHEGAGVAERYGTTVPRYLADIGILDSPVVAAHCVWMTDDDIRLFAEASVGVAHCPVSNGKHASGVARVSEMRAAGIPVAVATDGPSSHDRLDMFEEMRAALRMARLRSGDASAMTPSDVLTMATREAGAVLGRSDLGHLGPGARADLVQIDISGLGPVIDDQDLITHLVYSGSPEIVRSVWVGGQQVVGDGAPLLVDIVLARDEVISRARRLAGSSR
jgi:5-methylthioadenosine/S-adenosylhomocysteine deaminase